MFDRKEHYFFDGLCFTIMTVLTNCGVPGAESSYHEAAVPWDRFLSKSKIPQGPTDELLTWLHKINQKKNALKSSRAKDLRKDTLLENARRSAINFLQSKQSARLIKWTVFKRSLSKNVDEKCCDCDPAFSGIARNPRMHGQCCNILGKTQSGFMDIRIEGKVWATVSEDEDSLKVDHFLASLSSNVTDKKRKNVDDWSSRKRCKA